MKTSPDSDVQPPDFVRVAWHMVKRGPVTVALRLASDFLTNLVGWSVVMLLLVGALIVFFAGPSAAVVVGGFGIVASATGLVLALDAIVMGTVWSHATRTATDDDRALSATNSVKEGLEHFGDALLLRTINFLTRLAVLALFVAWALPLSELLTRSGGVLGSPVWIPALIAGAAATGYSIAAGLAALTVEMVAPAYFMKKLPLGSAIREAAVTVAERPIFIYRVFVTALGILLPALLIAWAASIGYALTFENPTLGPVLALARTVTNLLLFATLGLFVVMLQFSFFAYFAHRMGLRSTFPPGWLDAPAVDERPIPISELIPTDIVHRLSIAEVLGPRAQPATSVDDGDVRLDSEPQKAEPDDL